MPPLARHCRKSGCRLCPPPASCSRRGLCPRRTREARQPCFSSFAQGSASLRSSSANQSTLRPRKRTRTRKSPRPSASRLGAAAKSGIQNTSPLLSIAGLNQRPLTALHNTAFIKPNALAQMTRHTRNFQEYAHCSNTGVTGSRGAILTMHSGAGHTIHSRSQAPCGRSAYEDCACLLYSPAATNCLGVLSR